MFRSFVKPCEYTMARHHANVCFRVDIFLDGPGGDLSSTEYVFGHDINAESAKRLIADKYIGDWHFEVSNEQ